MANSRESARHILGVAAFGLGVVSGVFAVGLPTYLGPAVKQIPYDLKPQTVTSVASDAVFPVLDNGTVTTQRGALENITELVPRARATKEAMTGARNGTAVVWNAYETTRRPGTNPPVIIDASSAEFAFDRRSGATVAWNGAWISDNNPQPAAFDGQQYTFPFDTGHRDYRVYDRIARAAFPARYQGTSNLKGLSVLRFEMVVPQREIPMSNDTRQALTAAFGHGGSGRLTYSNVETIWVEPTSGTMVSVAKRQREAFVASDGTETEIYRANMAFDDATAARMINLADDARRSINLLTIWAPTLLGGLAASLLSGGAFLALRHGRTAPSVPLPFRPGRPAQVGDDAGAADLPRAA